jgi:DNA primase
VAFPPGFIEELRQRTSLSGLIARRVKLTRKGNQSLGLCPFHNEKTPSFYVYEDDGHYKCFGCGVYGDAFAFLEATEGLGFREAVERLANEAGLEIPKDRPVDEQAQAIRRTLEDAMAAAVDLYHTALRRPEGAEALAYLGTRGVTANDIASFKLGAAPSDGRYLKSRMLADGFSEEILIAAGLLGEGKEGRPSYDYFRNRVLFPIGDRKGRWIALGGRVLDDSKPKYLNSPETPLFSKGRSLYALSKAREATAKGQSALVAEGYMDVIALHRAGFTGAMAPLGTALTEDQLSALWKLANEPILCFDGDRAGRAAALKAADRAMPLLTSERSLRVVLLPDGQDPDDLLTEAGGPARFNELLNAALPLSSLLWEAELAEKPIDGPERLADLKRRLYARADRITERDLRQMYLEDIGRRLRKLTGDESEGRRDGRRPWTPQPRKSNAARRFGPPPPPESVANVPSQQHGLMWLSGRSLLAVLLRHPPLIGEFAEPLAALTLSDPAQEQLRHALVNGAESFESLDVKALATHFEGLGFGRLLADFAKPSLKFTAAAVRHDTPIEEARQACASYLEHLRRTAEAADRLEMANRALTTLADEDGRNLMSERYASRMFDNVDATDPNK